MNTILEVKDLRTIFKTGEGIVSSVDGVSFNIHEGETVALVGESGCGKSVTSYSIMKLVDFPGEIINGSIAFNGQDLVPLKERDMRQIRGNEMSMIFQEPLSSLNPTLKIGVQMNEIFQLHQNMSKKEATIASIGMLKKVGIPRPESVIKQYPHELSGGMRQRVMIGMALSGNPKLLIADEPTTALDVTIQAQILKLMRDLKDEMNTSTLLITHDLGVVAELADRVIVMYAGQVVEERDVFGLFDSPKHPYTRGLLNSTPKIDQEGVLESIEGNVPSASNKPTGCYFHPRCPVAMDICKTKNPPLYIDEETQGKVRCFLYEEGEAQ